MGWVASKRAASAVFIGALIAAVAPGLASADNSHGKQYVEPSLLAKAQQSPNAFVRVIVQGDSSTAAQAAVLATGGTLDGDRLGRRLGLVHGTAAVMKAKRVAKLKDAKVVVTPDLPVGPSDYSSSELWPFASGNAQLWGSLDPPLLANAPTIAVIDSGIDSGRADFGGRVVASATFATAAPNSAGDGLGHGTFV